MSCDMCRLQERLGEVTKQLERTTAERDMLVRWVQKHPDSVEWNYARQVMFDEMAAELPKG